MSTIADVARLTGVSVCTVSHAIHGTRPVREETRQRILEAAEKLGYRPNRIARGLKTKRTHTVGVMVSHVRVPSVGTLVTGAEGVLVSHGYSVILCCAPPVLAEEEVALSTLTDLRVDGLLVVGRSTEFVAKLERFEDLPVVLAHGRVRSKAVDWVDVDDESAFQIATEHLLSMGHRRVAFMGRPAFVGIYAARRDGYRRALRDRAIPVDDSLVQGTSADAAEVRAALDRLLALPSRPTALVIGHEQIALEAYVYLKERGLRIPHDLAVVGMGDDTWTRVVDPPLTKVAVPSLALGEAAAGLLVSRLESSVPMQARSILLEAALVVRESCGALLVRHP